MSCPLPCLEPSQAGHGVTAEQAGPGETPQSPHILHFEFAGAACVGAHARMCTRYLSTCGLCLCVYEKAQVHAHMCTRVLLHSYVYLHVCVLVCVLPETDPEIKI